MTPRRPGRGGLVLAAVAAMGCGLAALAASLRIPEGQGYTAIGPRAFPLIVSGGIAILGVVLLLRVVVWPDRDLLQRAASEAQATYWPAPLLLIAALLAYALALAPLGFVLATTPFFAGAARILDDRRPLRALSMGLLVSLVTYLGFTRLLGIGLPPGLLAGIL